MRVRFPSASLLWLGVMLVLQSGPQPGRTNPGVRARSVPGSIPDRVTGYSQVVEFGRHATLRRSCPQGRASSSLALATDRTTAGGQGPNWLSYGRCARFDTGTCNLRVGQCSFGPHKPGLPVCDSRTRYLIVAEYANRQSDEVENLVILQVRFLPRSLTRSRGPAAKTPG